MKTILCFSLFVVVLSNSLYAQTGLIGSYPFSGNANDVSGNGNNGNVNGATLTTDRFGNPNSAYLFNGVNNYIDLGNGFNYGSHSFSCWARKDSITGGNTLVSKINNGPYDMQNSEYGVNGFTIGTGTGWSSLYSVTPVVDLSQWNCFVVTYDAVSHIGKIYVNGVLDSMNMGTYSDVTNTPVFIGARPYWNGNGGPAFFFMGAIDEVNIYNRVLTQQEVDSLCPSLSLNVSSVNTMHLKISPNPFSEQTQLTSDRPFENVSLVIYNSSGQRTVEMNGLTGHTIAIKREGLPNGIYFAQLFQDGLVVANEKLILSE